MKTKRVEWVAAESTDRPANPAFWQVFTMEAFYKAALNAFKVAYQNGWTRITGISVTVSIYGEVDVPSKRDKR